MVRDIDYQARKMAILEATINKYIEEAAPISSQELAQDFDLSSATIRNIFAELEEEGFLTHPHTSAGRVPTKKGYRFYVDCLTARFSRERLPEMLLDDEKERIINEYKKQIDRLEDILDKTSGVISMVTRYTGITSFLKWQDKFFHKGISHILELPEFQDARKIRMLIKMFEEKDRLLDIINRNFNDKIKVYIGEETGCPDMENCSLVVSTYSLKDRPVGRLAVLGPMRMQYEHIIPVLEYISDVLTEILDRF